MYPPDLDATSGRSYKQGSQTAGALGGRRDSVQWYKDGAVSTHNMIVKVAGAAWRLIRADAQVEVAPTASAVAVDILAKMPGESSYESVFNVLPSIPVGEYVSSGGVFDPERKILPIGTLVKQSIGSGGAASDLLVALGKDVSPREQSRLVGTWDTPIAIAGITSDDPRIYPITATLWFAANDDDGRDAMGWGVGARTKDGGDTWSATPDPGVGSGGIKHIAVDAGGRLWIIVHASSSIPWHQTKIYHSDTDGDSWTLSYTYGTGAYAEQVEGWMVVPHPTDQDTIAVMGFSNGLPSVGVKRGFTLITKNRGSSWTSHLTSEVQFGQDSVMQYYDAVMLSDGRILVQGPFIGQAPVKWYALYSDTDGASWVEGIVHTSGYYRTNGLYVSADEGTIAYMLSDSQVSTAERHKLYVSGDQGENYSVVNLAQELQGLVGLGADLFMISRFISSTLNAAMYVATDKDTDIVKLSPISSSGVWTDLTDAYPHALQGNDNLGVLPGDGPSGAIDGNIELHYRSRAVSQ